MSLETLKDLDTTVKMLRRPFQGSVDLVGRMLRYNKRHLGKTTRSALKASSNAWLEYRYGWQPLLMDAETIISAAHKIRGKLDKRRLVARASVKKAFVTSSGGYVTGGLSCPGVDRIDGITKIESDLAVSAGVVYDLASQTTIDQLQQTMGSRASDLPANIWECVPYSFVIDWFANVGEWIQAITPNPAVTIKGNWATSTWHKKRVDSNLSIVSSVVLADGKPYLSKASLHDRCLVQSSVQRLVNLSMPSTPVVMKRPLSPLHSVDGAALLSNRIGGLLSGLRH